MSGGAQRGWRRPESDEVLEFVGWHSADGGQANIAKVRDASGRHFALKEFRVNDKAPPERQEEELASARLAARVEWVALNRVAEASPMHRVVRAIDYFPGDSVADPPWILLEWIDGPTLKDLLVERDRRPTKWREPDRAWRLEVAKAIVTGAADLHRCETIWRDGHFENIKLTDAADPRSVRFLDFGISRTPDQGTRTIVLGRGRGYPGFYPPERLKRDPERERPSVDAEMRDDVWVTAASLHAVLFLALPFQRDFAWWTDPLDHATHAKTLALTLLKLFEETPEHSDRAPELPDGAASFDAEIGRAILCALRVRPERRFRDCIEFARVLVPLLDESLQAARMERAVAAARASIEAEIASFEARSAAAEAASLSAVRKRVDGQQEEIHELTARVKELGSQFTRDIDATTRAFGDLRDGLVASVRALALRVDVVHDTLRGEREALRAGLEAMTQEGVEAQERLFAELASHDARREEITARLREIEARLSALSADVAASGETVAALQRWNTETLRAEAMLLNDRLRALRPPPPSTPPRAPRAPAPSSSKETVIAWSSPAPPNLVPAGRDVPPSGQKP